MIIEFLVDAMVTAMLIPLAMVAWICIIAVVAIPVAWLLHAIKG